VVDCAENLQKERALKREGMTPEILDGILMAQASRADRRSIADDLISNDSNLEALRAHVESLDLQFKQFFKH
jgi:dephospho-CoA kinase